MIQLISIDGTTQTLDKEAEGEPTLKQLYVWLNCETIEVPGGGFTIDGKEIQFVVDEEGKINERPVNQLATAYYNDVVRQDPRGLVADWDTINGACIVLTGKHLLK